MVVIEHGVRVKLGRRRCRIDGYSEISRSFITVADWVSNFET